MFEQLHETTLIDVKMLIYQNVRPNIFSNYQYTSLKKSIFQNFYQQ